MKPLLLPQVRESIEHNSHVSSQLTDHASKKIKAEQSDQSASTDSNTADAQESGKSSHKNDENLSDEQRRKIEKSYWLRTPNPRNRIPMTIQVRLRKRTQARHPRRPNPGRGLFRI